MPTHSDPPDASFTLSAPDAPSIHPLAVPSTPSSKHREPAEKLTTMAQVRLAVDEIDREIVDLLGQRMRYIEAAARIKPVREVVRDEWRKRDVIDKAACKAREVGFPEQLARDVYEVLVEGCIAYEETKWDKNHKL